MSTQDLGARPGCGSPCVVTYGYYTRPAPSQTNMNTQWTLESADVLPPAAYVIVPWKLKGIKSRTLATLGVSSAIPQGRVTNHWTISGVSQFQTGPPTTVGISNIDTNGDGQFNDRPSIGNASASIYTYGEDGQFVQATKCNGVTTTYNTGTLYDLTAVQSCTKTGTGYVTSYQPVLPSAVHWIIAPGSGNVARNTFPSPGDIINNVSVEKDFGLGFIHHLEGHAIQLRVEAQNIANHNNVLAYNTNVNNLVGSQVNSTIFVNKSYSRPSNEGRQVRLWAKYQF